MPNWSFNRMSVHTTTDAEKAEVKRLRETIKRVKKIDGKDVETLFSFQNIIPMPEELEDTEAPVVGGHDYNLIRKYGYDNWYDWRWENWGTKWDARDVCDESEDDTLMFTFDTAWSFPIPVVVKLSQMFPTLTFSFDAEEEFGMYDFTVDIKNGKVLRYVTYEYKWNNKEDEEEGDISKAERIEVKRPVSEFM